MNPSSDGRFLAQGASNVENVSMSRRHYSEIVYRQIPLSKKCCFITHSKYHEFSNLHDASTLVILLTFCEDMPRIKFGNDEEHQLAVSLLSAKTYRKWIWSPWSLQWRHMSVMAYWITGNSVVCSIADNKWYINMMTSSNGNIFRVTGHLCGKFTGSRWIPRTKAGDAELWCFLWSASEKLFTLCQENTTVTGGFPS